MTISETLPNAGDRNWDIPLNAKLLELVRNANAVHNVIQYGATGNGSTDDTAAIQAAIDACELTKGIVLFPPGVYATSSALTIDSPSVTLLGSGRDATKIRSTATTGDMITISNAAVFCGVRDLTLTRTARASSGNGIQFTGTGEIGYARLENLYIEQSYRGLYTGPCTFGWITNVACVQNESDGFFFTNNTTTGALQWEITGSLAQLNGGSGFRVFAQNTGASQITLGNWNGIYTFGNDGYGISLEGHASVPIHDFRLSDAFIGEDGASELRMDTYGGSHILSNVFTELSGTRTTGPDVDTPATNAGHGIEITGNNDDVTIVGGVHFSNSYCGIFTSGSQVTISGVAFKSNGISGSGAAQDSGVYVNAGSATITGSASWGAAYGVYANVDDVLVVGNDLAGTTAAFGSTTLSSSLLESNRGYDEPWRTFTASPTGFSGTPTTAARYKKIGKHCTVYFSTTGTSNATTLTFTLPFASESAVMFLGPVVTNSGTVATTPGRIALTAGSSTATVTRDGNGAAWTNSGTKAVSGYTFTYEVD